ncbi:hypothetical protein Nepgr_022164 [Nepenthes gracilis]|uniref:RING-CH-type domain-containing protein n=1 Tax=Nepenthes gracilis TaxID=150966 RepID=A0AAD3XWQ2_NEPGR|nr:hypothetical protein Nepgr_022164 [Nepenthes gracilis]
MEDLIERERERENTELWVLGRKSENERDRASEGEGERAFLAFKLYDLLPDLIENGRSYCVATLGEAVKIDISSHKINTSDGLSPRKLVECRICHDEEIDSNMETPCSCCGSLKYAHRRCVQRWCDEKGDTLCEICQEQFRPGYTAPPPFFECPQTPLNFRGNWGLNRTDLNNSHIMETVSTDGNHLDSDYDDSSSRSLRSLSIAVIFIGILILRHILQIFVNGSEFHVPLFALAVVRITGSALLVFILMLAVTGLRWVWHLPGLPAHDVSDILCEETPEQHHSHVIQILQSEE